MCIYRNKNIVIIGVGKTGISCINFFVSLGIFPKVVDEDKNPKYKNLIPNFLNCFWGGLNDDWIINSDIIVISPGVSSDKEIIVKAKMKGIEIINDIEIFFREVSHNNIILVTGTNGKTTVVTLLYEICLKSNINVCLGGNVGVPVLSLLNKSYDLYIIELSSFQLDYVKSIKSLCSCILNITSDHLDRYNDFMNYVNSKIKILKNSENYVVNMQILNFLDFKCLSGKLITFGNKLSDYFINFYNNNNYLSKNFNNMLDVKKINYKGEHNYLNYLSIIAICDILNISKKIYLKNITEFKGLPYRLQVIYENKGVVWINDSKSTNTFSTIYALKSLSNLNINKIWLILGGVFKCINFDKYFKSFIMSKSNVFICCYGESSLLINNLFPLNSKRFFVLRQVIKYISKKIVKNDVVLLSPACSSLDQFRSYKERGEEFNYLTKKYG